MNKKLLLSLAVIMVIVWCNSSVFAGNLTAVPIPTEERIAPAPPAMPGDKDYCVMQNDNGVIAYYFGGFLAGYGVAAYMDPMSCGVPNPYPFRVTDAHFYLYNFGGAVWPVQIQVNIKDLVGGDSCNGPGTILCSETFTIPIDSAYPLLMNLSLSSLCCVNGPFFMEIIYTGGTSSPYPSPLFTNPSTDPADTCNNWLLYAGVYYEWYNAWSPPVPGNIVLRATGNTQDPECMPWHNHKMHFPQLPDLIGWDVNATQPKTLADDWQCSQAGWVTDIHFWGSWKDTDQNPTTDNYYTPYPMFVLSIHENIPATPDTPWSRPGRQVWGWEGEIPGIPFDPPSLEGWYDPNTGIYNCNDHRAYWRYDFVNMPDSFFQFKNKIYWLNVSAVNIPPPYQWGWKNSRDHFMDDAVYTDTLPPGPWYPIVEPPRCNWFDVYFNTAGYPEDLGSTNYYGDAWYRYEYWTNMWFYDNPFTYTRPKHIWLNFNIEIVGPQAYAEFAINWSTPDWDTMEMGRPPLPGENEMLYIGRQVFQVNPGPNTIDYTLPYNPEWVSIDFVARDVVISGWIWHECIGTSLDLAFVITGHEGVPPVTCGDVNDDDVIDVGDIVYLINYLFKQPWPDPQPSLCVGDVNNDDVVDIGDVVYLINYLFKQPWPDPDPNCCNPPWK